MNDESPVSEVVAKLPEPQVRELFRLTCDYPGSTWHLNECGCCVCLHPDGDGKHGWIIGADGGSHYVRHEL